MSSTNQANSTGYWRILGKDELGPIGAKFDLNMDTGERKVWVEHVETGNPKSGANRGGVESILDTPITVTRFLSQTAKTKREHRVSLRALAGYAKKHHKPNKADLEWIKLASFGNKATERGSLRHDRNMVSISGVEGDYDAGDMPPEVAAEKLKEANVAALIYTTPSHGRPGKGNRWRVLCPISEALPVDKRAKLLARVNGVLGGVVAPESFTNSQSYYIGSFDGGSPVQTILLEGRPIDACADLDTTAIGKQKPEQTKVATSPTDDRATAKETPATITPDIEPEVRLAIMSKALHRLSEAVAKFRDASPEGVHQIVLAATRHIANDVAVGWLSEEDAVEAIRSAALRTLASRDSDRLATAEGDEVPAALKLAMEKGLQRDAEPPPPAPEFPPMEGAEKQKSAAKFQWLGIDEVEAMPDPTWLIADVLPSQGVAVTFGPPKQGKTFTVLSQALCIAAGQPWFGKKVDKGAVYYIAGEGAGGLKLRIKAARQHYGIPRGIPFHVLTRAAKFTDEGEIGALITSIRAVHELSGVPGRLIVIDTLARAMPGSDENATKDMGLVIEQCDRVREAFQCLVMPVHHTGKDVARGMRGSSSLDGAVDCAIQVTRENTQTSDVVTIENVYQKEGEEFSPRYFDLVKVSDRDGGRGSLALTPRAMAPVKAKATSPRHDAVMRNIRGLATDLPEGERLTKAAVIARCADDQLVTTASRPNDRRRTVGDFISALVSDGQLGEDGEHVWLNEPSLSLTDLTN